ncbi:MAG: response regulator transcription factor [Flavobacteriales bacterium]
METQKATLLLVEDDLNLGFVIQDSLKMNGYKVHLATDGMQGLKQFNEQPYDLILLDVMLPYKDGFTLAEDIRKTNSTTPIVFLTAKSMTEDKIKGFRAGGDDYITKPFSTEEFLLRIEAILKRTGKGQIVGSAKETFQLGSYTFDYGNFQLKRENDVKKLTKKEAEVLRLLCMHKNQVIQRELVLTMVWGSDDYFLGRSLDVFITKLRKYLKDDETVNITNIHGVGFKLECP